MKGREKVSSGRLRRRESGAAFRADARRPLYLEDLAAGRGATVAIAVATVDRLAVRRVERHLGGLAARVARDVVERPGAAVAEAAALALVAANLAALGLVREPLLSVELLLVRREDEGGAAADTADGLVRVHRDLRGRFLRPHWNRGERGVHRHLSSAVCGGWETFTGSGTSGGIGGRVFPPGTPRG